MTDEASVYVVDDDQGVLLSVEALLSQHGYSACCYASAAEFLADVALDTCGCLVTDVRMPEISGIELQRRLRAASSPLAVVVVTGVADVPMAVTLMEGGAVTLLEKPYDHNELLDAVKRGLAASRERWNRRQQEHDVATQLATLTGEERQVMELMVAGKPNKAIARGLGLGMRTIDRRRRTVLEKMGVETVPELALLLGTARAAEPELQELTKSVPD
jgi:FixJ family two-component response regulator